MLQTRTEPKRRKGDVPLERRGVYTAPPQSGGFGYNNTTLSQLKGYKGVVMRCSPGRLSSWLHCPLLAGTLLLVGYTGKQDGRRERKSM